MGIIASNIEIILTVTGAATLLGWLALGAPDFVWRHVMGRPSHDLAERLAIRVIGAVIGMDGVLLIWAASAPEIRPAVLAFAIVCKGLFALMAFANRKQIPTFHLMFLAVADSVMVALYILYLLGF